MAISESHDCAVIVPARWETDPLLAWRCVNSKHAVFNAFLIFVHESQNLAGLLSSMLFHLPRNGVALGLSGPKVLIECMLRNRRLPPPNAIDLPAGQR
jgi:hypothetical protein